MSTAPKHEFESLIEGNEIDVKDLPSLTQTAITKYNEMAAEENPNLEQLDKLGDEIWDEVMDYLEPEEEEKPIEQKTEPIEKNQEQVKEEKPAEKPVEKVEEKPSTTSEFPTAVKPKEEKPAEKPLYKKILGF